MAQIGAGGRRRHARDRGGTQRHLRVLARHGLRVVRLLHLRDARAVLRGAVFPSGNDTAALLASFATYAAGFLVRPFGAIVFGRIGDLVGRKYTFLVTILVMGLSTAAVGILPTYATIGMLSPAILVLLRLAQGLALGGEYGGAATYVAEHAPDGARPAHELDPDHRHARILPFAGHHRRVPAGMRRRRSRAGAGACLSWCRSSCSASPSTSGSSSTSHRCSRG